MPDRKRRPIPNVPIRHQNIIPLPEYNRKGNVDIASRQTKITIDCAAMKPHKRRLSIGT